MSPERNCSKFIFISGLPEESKVREPLVNHQQNRARRHGTCFHMRIPKLAALIPRHAIFPEKTFRHFQLNSSCFSLVIIDAVSTEIGCDVQMENLFLCRASISWNLSATTASNITGQRSEKYLIGLGRRGIPLPVDLHLGAMGPFRNE